MKSKIIYVLTLLALLCSVVCEGQSEEFVGNFTPLSRTGIKFVYYLQTLKDDGYEMKLVSDELFPDKNDFEVLQKKCEKYRYKIRLDSARKVLSVKYGENGKGEVILAEIQKYFPGPLRRVHYYPKDNNVKFIGPWEVWSRDGRWMAESDDTNELSISLSEEIRSDGSKMLTGRIINTKNGLDLVQFFVIEIEGASARVLEQKWYYSGTRCGESYLPSRQHPDYWRLYYKKFLVDLPPELRKYFSASVRRQMLILAQKWNPKMPKHGTC